MFARYLIAWWQIVFFTSGIRHSTTILSVSENKIYRNSAFRVFIFITLPWHHLDGCDCLMSTNYLKGFREHCNDVWFMLLNPSQDVIDLLGQTSVKLITTSYPTTGAMITQNICSNFSLSSLPALLTTFQRMKTLGWYLITVCSCVGWLYFSPLQWWLCSDQLRCVTLTMTMVCPPGVTPGVNGHPLVSVSVHTRAVLSNDCWQYKLTLSLW